jgi:diguanylate cyclase (GGDEF)-like protein
MDTKLIELLYGELLVSYECSADDKMNFISFPSQLPFLLGYDGSEGKSFRSMWDLVTCNELEKRKHMLSDQLETNYIEVVLPFEKKDGSTQWFLNRGRRLDKSVVGMLVPIRLIKNTFDRQTVELDQYKSKLERTKSMVGELQIRAERDALTKLYNADTTKSLCSQYLSESGQMCAMLMFDLDGFKNINDLLGHIEGNAVLIQVADTIKTLFRSGDIIGRVGGDEFLVLMKDIHTVDIVDRKCSEIVNAISNNVKIARSLDFGCSVGAVVSYTGTLDYDELFSCADRTMYHVKNNGRKSYCVKQMF